MDLYSAHWHANQAMRFLIRADAIATETGRSPESVVNAGLQDLRLAAKALGYKLTPINPDPQAEHEAALARRIAENEPEVFNDPRNERAA